MIRTIKFWGLYWEATTCNLTRTLNPEPKARPDPKPSTHILWSTVTLGRMSIQGFRIGGTETVALCSGFGVWGLGFRVRVKHWVL